MNHCTTTRTQSGPHAQRDIRRALNKSRTFVCTYMWQSKNDAILPLLDHADMPRHSDHLSRTDTMREKRGTASVTQKHQKRKPITASYISCVHYTKYMMAPSKTKLCSLQQRFSVHRRAGTSGGHEAAPPGEKFMDASISQAEHVSSMSHKAPVRLSSRY